MDRNLLDPGLPLIQDADLKDKIVLIRVDHNVVKNGKIKDPYRIDASLPTLFRVVEQGGRPVLMTHVGRPRDKKTGNITEDGHASIEPIVAYLERKLDARFVLPRLEADGDRGLQDIEPFVGNALRDLKERRITGVYLPNTRCFQGEESGDETGDRFARQLASIADIYVNDAFGSWQPHTSTYEVTRHLPAFAGLLMQKELVSLKQVLEPARPFVAILAGSKVDTKIGPLRRIHERVDHLILGGILYNAYLCAKYGIQVEGVDEKDIEAAGELVRMDRGQGKVVELQAVEESDILHWRETGRCWTRWVRDFEEGQAYGPFLDAAPESFDFAEVAESLRNARTIFVNAVMGYTPHFAEGTERLNREIADNEGALKLFGGGDTLQEFKNLNPALYLKALEDPLYYFFTGGGTVLKAIEEGSPYALEPVKALVENGGVRPSP